MDGWNIIQAFINSQDAYMAQAYLESEGIETIIQDELTAQFYPNAVGGVKLLIRDTDIERGIQVLKDGGYIISSEDGDSEDWIWVKKGKDACHCPFCHSDKIEKLKNQNLLTEVLYCILGVLFPLFRPSWKCDNCGKVWKYRRK